MTKQSTELTGTETSASELEEIYEGLSDKECAAVKEVAKANLSNVRAPNLKLYFDREKVRLEVGHENKNPKAAAALSMYELSTSDPRFYSGVISQVARLGEHGEVASETSSNFVMSVVAAVKPEDEIEAMLAVQMGAVHQATMMMARRLNHVENIPQQDAADRALNKLARTFTSQVETLKRYRSKADQTVRVERVEVREGGQAIVGDVHHGGRVNDNK